MNKVFTLKLSDALITALRNEAHKREIPMAQLIREALKKYLTT